MDLLRVTLLISFLASASAAAIGRLLEDMEIVTPLKNDMELVFLPYKSPNENLEIVLKPRHDIEVVINPYGKGAGRMAFMLRPYGTLHDDMEMAMPFGNTGSEIVLKPYGKLHGDIEYEL